MRICLMTTIKEKLIQAVTEYDRKDAQKRGQDCFLLGCYIDGVNDICDNIESGMNICPAIAAVFDEFLTDFCMKAIEKTN